MQRREEEGPVGGASDAPSPQFQRCWINIYTLIRFSQFSEVWGFLGVCEAHLKS